MNPMKPPMLNRRRLEMSEKKPKGDDREIWFFLGCLLAMAVFAVVPEEVFPHARKLAYFFFLIPFFSFYRIIPAIALAAVVVRLFVQ